MEHSSWHGVASCTLSNGTVEVVVTAGIGPRIVEYRFAGETNVLGEALEGSKVTGLGEWRPVGGHRLWAAPESLLRTYYPDNDAVDVVEENGGVRFTSAVEHATSLQKDVVVSLADTGSSVTVRHRITNRGIWPVEVAPWAITVTRGGGVAIVPQETYAPHGDERLLPSRVMSLWSYSDLSDPRFGFGRGYTRVRSDVAADSAVKIGVSNSLGWLAYAVDGLLFVKRFGFEAAATYPDGGCNAEVFTAGGYMELESLGPIAKLEPGESTEHVERWSLTRIQGVPESDAEIDAVMARAD